MKYLLVFISFINIAIAENVIVSQQIEINADIDKVFYFVSNPLNDHKWRTEVHEITADGVLTEGTVYREDAFIGLRYHFITETYLEQLVAPHIAIFKTTDSNPYYLRSSRLVIKNGKKTIFKYVVEFDKAMIKKVFGVGLNANLVSKAYGARMLKYLFSLKRILEKKPE